MTPTIPRHAYQFFQEESADVPQKIDAALEAIRDLSEKEHRGCAHRWQMRIGQTGGVEVCNHCGERRAL